MTENLISNKGLNNCFWSDIINRPVQQVAAKFLPQKSSETSQSSTVYVPPEVVSAANRILISNVPEISPQDLDKCALERIINHIKDGYIKGQYVSSSPDASASSTSSTSAPPVSSASTASTDSQPTRPVSFEEYCAGREFKFCTAYTFLHDGENLVISFFISVTEDAPTWVSDHRGKLISMTDEDVSVVFQNFIEQCTKALQNYLNMVFNHAAKHHIVPDYYSTSLPS